MERGAPDGTVLPGWQDWSKQTVVIVASGPSARHADLEQARSRAKVLCVNTSYRLAPWADALYACDGKWWDAHPDALAFKGLKYAYAAQCEHPNVFPVQIDIASSEILTRPGVIGSGGNGGFQALNLAVQFGAKRIVLVGYDMTLAGGVHWHGRHPDGLNTPHDEGVERWRQRLDAQADRLKTLGVEVINASAASALTAYRKLSLEAALAPVTEPDAAAPQSTENTMAWFRFDKPFLFTPSTKPQTSVGYKPGVYNVTRECAEKALAGGYGQKTVNPRSRRTKTDDKPQSDGADNG